LCFNQRDESLVNPARFAIRRNQALNTQGPEKSRSALVR
jgi:hypothetical protein